MTTAAHVLLPTRITIDEHPPVSLNSVLTMNRWQRTAHRKRWRELAAVAWMSAGRPEYERCRIVITLYARGDRQIQDADNLYGSVKPLIDGLRGRAFPDDAIDHIGIPMIQRRVDNEHPRVVIELFPADERG